MKIFNSDDDIANMERKKINKYAIYNRNMAAILAIYMAFLIVFFIWFVSMQMNHISPSTQLMADKMCQEIHDENGIDYVFDQLTGNVVVFCENNIIGISDTSG